MKKALIVLLILLLALSGCGKKHAPSQRELAQTETGWDATYMQEAPEYVPPEGLTLVEQRVEGRVLHFAIRNDRSEDWMGNYAAAGQMQALVDGKWYIIPDMEPSGSMQGMVGGAIMIAPGKTLGTSFVPGNFPPGQYRRIWNGVALPFELLP